ncbi:MAG: hypothetical protein H6943_07875 [Zoogloeaceae bacterium]|nr:hypothetical protein [Zoogloeaceae bacterium]
MPNQAAAMKRCATCDRWSGPRTPGTPPDSVDLASESDTGRCVGGPWDGSERRVRSACGHWILWQMLTYDNGTS